MVTEVSKKYFIVENPSSWKKCIIELFVCIVMYYDVPVEPMEYILLNSISKNHSDGFDMPSMCIFGIIDFFLVVRLMCIDD